ncbi:hypothetical protein G3485_07870 [Shewanella baltica]|uniref:Uncharacterized protein n=1 Tax=Shewanella baltica (strain OS155 / ATCC BAA-1091) TaxID=325240 RepID=A3D3A2_SHEB5|nr:hypothetical protein [Shewanella baltica]ABN61215.1 conserved hypothetical protein [Shewanella baltica OS155]AEH13566.1 hypothetical protein Sbal117_1819 [Shewanella baltica OS117]MCS6126619.1 hypothetical protein [Shewanella baltica]MCS6138692.1 hypothetical protein [Shewanella baltica]MCS6144881.1 hypothetical protein [Shewanella baltica]
MYHQFLNEPMVLDAEKASILTLRLPDDISDFIVLQAISAPLLEVVVIAEAGTPQNIAIRFQPFMGLKVESLPQSAQAFNTPITRSLGQGFRLYTRMGTAAKFCAAELRRGVSFTLDMTNRLGAENCLTFALQADSKFELVPLEADLRVLHEPKALMVAKALLARQYDYAASSESLAIYMTEIEQVRLELQAFLRGELGQCHASLADEVLRLDPLLLQKQQWLFRTYTHMFERPNYNCAANDVDNTDKLLRKLECYELLAPPELIQMVDRLMEDEA